MSAGPWFKGYASPCCSAPSHSTGFQNGIRRRRCTACGGKFNEPKKGTPRRTPGSGQVAGKITIPQYNWAGTRLE